MLTPAEILARGPWAPEDVSVVWREEPYVPEPAATAAADRLIEELRRRGSPSYDGQAGRLVSYEVTTDGRLHLELQPMRWALRLIPGLGVGSLSALCAVRDADGNWLAGRRAAWVATWAGRWALGAAGAVDVGESPAYTLERELREEWSVGAEKLSVEALMRTPNNTLMLVGQAWLPSGAEVTPDEEHDAFAWWPPAIKDWPAESSFELTELGLLLTGGSG
jgi:ADP-ribose pyrophosphatase YjhB (NUDIX family)